MKKRTRQNKAAAPLAVIHPLLPHVFDRLAEQIFGGLYEQADRGEMPDTAKLTQRAERTLRRHRPFGPQTWARRWLTAKRRYIKRARPSAKERMDVKRLAEPVFRWCLHRGVFLRLCLPAIRRELFVPPAIRDADLERIIRCLCTYQLKLEWKWGEEYFPILMRTYYLRQHSDLLREFTNLTPTDLARLEAAISAQRSTLPTPGQTKLQAFFKSLPRTAHR